MAQLKKKHKMAQWGREENGAVFGGNLEWRARPSMWFVRKLQLRQKSYQNSTYWITNLAATTSNTL